MASLGEVEDAIFNAEGFRVTWTHVKSGRDARRDRTGYTPYDKVNQFNGERTVTDFIKNRLAEYDDPAIKPVVRYRDGAPAHGGTQLKNIRATYGSRR